MKKFVAIALAAAAVVGAFAVSTKDAAAWRYGYRVHVVTYGSPYVYRYRYVRHYHVGGCRTYVRVNRWGEYRARRVCRVAVY